MKKLLFVLFAFSAVFVSCSKDESDETPDYSKEIVGTWKSQSVPVEVIVEGTNAANVAMIKSGLSEDLKLNLCFKADGSCEAYEVDDDKPVVLKGPYTVSSNRLEFSVKYEAKTETSSSTMSISMNCKLEKDGADLFFVQDKEAHKYALNRNVESIYETEAERENARIENEALLKTITNCRVVVRMVKQL